MDAHRYKVHKARLQLTMYQHYFCISDRQVTLELKIKEYLLEKQQVGSDYLELWRFQSPLFLLCHLCPFQKEICSLALYLYVLFLAYGSGEYLEEFELSIKGTISR